MNLEDAEALARKALSFKPNDGYILDTVGWVLFKRGDLESAIRYLEAAYKIKSNESVIVEHLADAYTQKELIDKAAALYRKALELEPDQKKVQQIRQKLSALEKMDVDKSRIPASSSQPKPIRAPSAKPVSQNE